MNRCVLTLILLGNLLAARILECDCLNTRIEGRVAAFIPQSGRFRDIYGTAAPYYQLEVTWPTCQHWMGWANVSYFCKDGRSDPLKDKTTIRIVPLSAGVKYGCFLSKSIELYIGVGASYAWVNTRDHSSFVKSRINKHAFGGVLKLGLSKRCDWFYTSIFFDYQWQVTNSKHCRSVGGALLGGSIGVEF